MSDAEKKRVSLLLALSLALNVFIIGGVIGGLAVGAHFGPRHPGMDMQHGSPKPFISPRSLMREAPPEMHRKLMGVMREDWRGLEPHLADVHAARENVVAKMTADPFDGAEMTAAIEGLAEVEKQAHIASSETLIKMLHLLSAEERQRLSERAMVDRGKDHREHRRKRFMERLEEERPSQEEK